MPDLEGQSFAGCEIIAKLGQGGFGAVYKARQTDLDRFVAIKVLSRELSEDPEYVSRFKQEAAAAAKLMHPGIVQVHAAGNAEGTHFFVMEFVDGESVQRRIDREGKFTPTEAVAICIYVAEALEFAWKRAKLIHRDIKPDNIFLSSSAEVKLGDLGLAKQAGASTGLTRSGMMMGTPNYISPEQAQAKKEIDFRTDIYSLGCTLYHMVTGHLPYEGAGDALAIIHKHVYDPPPAIFKVWPECPMPLAMLIGKMVAKQPHERFQSYDELIAEMRRVYAKLEEAARAATVPAAPPAPAQVAPRVATPKRVKKPWLMGNGRWVMGGAGAVALLLLAGLFLWSPWKARQATEPGSAGVPPASAPSATTASSPTTRATATPTPTAGGTPALPGGILAPPETRVAALTANPKVGEVATLDLGGGVTIELMGIPLGEFMLGSTKEEQAWANANGCDQIFTKCEGEQPHKAAMKRGFWLGRTEVTVVQWKQFINARSYVTDAESKGSVEWVPAGAKKEGASWRDPRFGSSLKDSVPVTCVSWNDAMAFCDSLNNCEQKAGRLPSGYKARLPTEAEWEYACRAGTQTKFWWGDTKEGGNMCLNWAGAADGFDFVSPVDHYGARGRNKFSLADMLGNVCEWCLDEFDPAGAHGQPYKGNPSGRVARGGSFRSYPGSARCAARGTGKPLASNSFTGFRVCIGPDVLGSAATTAAPVTPADPQPSTISPQPSALSAFCREVAALPAEAQVQRVAVKLKELNPGFDGKAEHKIEAQSVTKITVDAFQLENLAPLRALIHLQMLVLKEVNFQRSRLEDLSPLQGMPLVHLSCGYNRVSDLSPLHGMPLRVLRLSTSLVKDLSPLVDSPLTHLEIQCTKVRDLSPVCAGNLTTLFCHLTPVTDLSPLRRTKLKELKCDFVPNRDMAILRSIKTLETINGLPAAEFWKRVEAGEAPQAK